MKTAIWTIIMLFFSTSGAGTNHNNSFPSLGFAIIGVILVAVAGVTVVLSALHRAPEGYEDQQGFHFIQSRSRPRHRVPLTTLRPRTAG